MESFEHFGPNLRRLIKAKGFKTYQKAADAFDISPSYLHQLMRGEREPSIEMLKTICNALGVTGADLLDPHVEPAAQQLNDSTAELLKYVEDKIKESNERTEALIRQSQHTSARSSELAELERLQAFIKRIVDLGGADLLDYLEKMDARAALRLRRGVGLPEPDEPSPSQQQQPLPSSRPQPLQSSQRQAATATRQSAQAYRAKKPAG